MDTKKILIGTLIGFIATFILGYVFYGMLLNNFFSSNAGSATGVSKDMDQIHWLFLILGHVALGALLAYVLGHWANISTVSSGAIAGATIGGLMSAANSLIMYATTNIMNMTGTIAEIVLSAVIAGIAGAAIGYYYGTTKK